MATRLLPLYSDSAPALIMSPDPGAARWRWSPDAKLLPSANGRYLVRNFANGTITEIDAAEGKLLSQISGLTFAFQMPVGVPPELVDKLAKRKVLLAPTTKKAFARRSAARSSARTA
jgi:hypothetical protein